MTIFFAKFSKIRNPFPPIGRSHLQFFFRFASVFSLFYSIGKDLLAVSSSSLLHAPPPIQTLRNEEGKASRFAGNRSRVTQLPGRRSSGYPLPRVLDGSCGGWSLRGASWKAAFFSSLLQFKDIYIFLKDTERRKFYLRNPPPTPPFSLSLSPRKRSRRVRSLADFSFRPPRFSFVDPMKRDDPRWIWSTSFETQGKLLASIEETNLKRNPMERSASAFHVGSSTSHRVDTRKVICHIFESSFTKKYPVTLKKKNRSNKFNGEN